MQQSLVRFENSPLPWYPRRVPAKCLSSDGHRQVNVDYCAPAWSRACSAADRVKLDSFISRSKRLGYCSQNQPSFTQLLDDADDSVFDRIKMNSEHVLQPYLPERQEICYSLRARSHNKTLFTKTVYTSMIKTIWYECYTDSYRLFHPFINNGRTRMPLTPIKYIENTQTCRNTLRYSTKWLLEVLTLLPVRAQGKFIRNYSATSNNNTLFTKTACLNDHDYLIRMLYKERHIDCNIFYISISPLTP